MGGRDLDEEVEKGDEQELWSLSAYTDREKEKVKRVEKKGIEAHRAPVQREKPPTAPGRLMRS